MTEEMINSDGSRNWEANILLDNVKRLEQENKEIYENGQIEITKLCNEKTKYRSALEEIREILNKECGVFSNAKVIGIINEVLGC